MDNETIGFCSPGLKGNQRDSGSLFKKWCPGMMEGGCWMLGSRQGGSERQSQSYQVCFSVDGEAGFPQGVILKI